MLSHQVNHSIYHRLKHLQDANHPTNSAILERDDAESGARNQTPSALVFGEKLEANIGCPIYSTVGLVNAFSNVPN